MTESAPPVRKEATLEPRNASCIKQTDLHHSHHSHLYILGSGSMGLFLAATIRDNHPSFPLTLLLRDHHAPWLMAVTSRNNKEDGVNKSQGVSHHINVSLKQGGCDKNIKVHARLVSRLGLASVTKARQEQEEGNDKDAPTAKEEKIEFVVLTTKAFQAVNALKSVQPHLAPNCRILVLCNGGLAVRDELERYFSDNLLGPSNTHGSVTVSNNHWTIKLGSITHGAYQEKPMDSGSSHAYRVVHAGVGQLFLVASQEETKNDISSMLLSPRMLEEAGLNPKFVSHQEMENILWYKLAANCVCNPLTAIHQCTNGLLHDMVADFDTILEKVVEEVCLVHSHCTSSITATYGDGSNDRNGTGNNGCSTTAALDPVLVTDFVRQVIHDNVDNHSSMQQDVYHKRPTEIEFLNGYIVRSGMKYGFDCPVNRELRDRVVSLEASYPRKKVVDSSTNITRAS